MAAQKAHADNVLPPYGTAKVTFTNPPPSAKHVVVRILERVRRYHGTHPYKQLGRFMGEFRGREFVVLKMVGAPPVPATKVAIHIVAGEGGNKGHLVGLVPDPTEIISHTLTVEVEADGFRTFKGKHRLHVGHPGAAMVFYQGGVSHTASFHSYAIQMANRIYGKRLSRVGVVEPGPWQFDAAASVVNQITQFYGRTGVKAKEIHVVGHTNNGLDFQSPEESRELAKVATDDVKIVWHGCYACNYFNTIRQAAFFGNIPGGTVYGHRNISVQAGMPWAFQRIRHDGEVNLTEVSEEVLPASYIVWWASQQTTADLQTTLNHPEAEVDVKVIVGAELGSRA